MNQVKAFGGTLMLVGYGGTAWILIWQAFTWLKTATWIPVSVITALRWFRSDWAVSPHNWYGLHELLSTFPFAAVLFLLGMFGYALVETQ